MKARRASTLRWRRVPGARYYNVQLYRGGRKVLSAWPLAASFHLGRAWTYRATLSAEARGLHVVRVAEMKPLPHVAYGPIVGQSSFVVR